MKKGVPISPEDIPEKKAEVIPPFVYDVFNDLIAQNYTNHCAKVYQKDVVKKITEKTEGKPWPIEWLNVEEVYRARGWKVYYDRPGYYESYDAYFEFTKPLK